MISGTKFGGNGGIAIGPPIAIAIAGVLLLAPRIEAPIDSSSNRTSLHFTDR